MKTIQRPIKAGLRGATKLLALLILLPAATAPGWPTYHDPARNDLGYCSDCHPGFKGGEDDALHALHTGGDDPVTGTCNLCHTGNTRNNPFIMWSAGDTGNNGLGCTGCHGQDYGETIQANYTNGTANFTIVGLHKNSGYGLRRHHGRSGVGVCATCHTNDVNIAPYGEEMINPGLGFTTHYYLRGDVSLQGKPVNPITNEDSTNDVDLVGLDNDGDRLYDGGDPDANTNALVRLSMVLSTTNTAVFNWPYTNDGWHLQGLTTLGSNWADVVQAPRETTNGTVWSILMSPVEETRFFRLRKQL